MLRSVLRALDEVAIRVSTNIRSRGRIYYLKSGALILFNPTRHETVADMADTLVHELLHWVRRHKYRESTISVKAGDLLDKSPVLQRRVYRKLAEAQMYFNGGGPNPVAGE